MGLRKTDLCLQNTCVCTTISSYIFSYASALSNYLFHIFVNTLVNECEKDRELYCAVHPFLAGLPLGGYSFRVLLGEKPLSVCVVDQLFQSTPNLFKTMSGVHHSFRRLF